MQDLLANVIYPILREGLRLKEKLAERDKPDALPGVGLRGGLRPPPDRGQGDAANVAQPVGSLLPVRAPRDRAPREQVPREQPRGKDTELLQEQAKLRGLMKSSLLDRDDPYLGLRYPLVCWLDEIFIFDCPPVRESWTDNSLEA